MKIDRIGIAIILVMMFQLIHHPSIMVVADSEEVVHVMLGYLIMSTLMIFQAQAVGLGELVTLVRTIAVLDG